MNLRLPLWLVVAIARNGVIGADNRLIWHISTDLQRFKTLTMGKAMVMGRKTYESIGKPLPGRETIVITRDRNFSASGVHVVHDLEAGLRLADEIGLKMGASAIAVIGGGEIYDQTIDRATHLFVTEVDLSPQGDTYFPQIDTKLWRETRRERFPAGAHDDAAFAFVDYERV